MSGPHSAQLRANLLPDASEPQTEAERKWGSGGGRRGLDSKVVVEHQSQEMVIWLNLQIIALPLPV